MRSFAQGHCRFFRGTGGPAAEGAVGCSRDPTGVTGVTMRHSFDVVFKVKSDWRLLDFEGED